MFMFVLPGRSYVFGSAMSKASLSSAGVIERLLVNAVFSGADALVINLVG